MSQHLQFVLECLPESGLQSIQPLFACVFGHEISTDLLDWKYADGRGQSWVARLEGELAPLVHCGVCFRDLTFAGRVVRAGQLVDLMAAPKGFGLSRGSSPFALLLRRVLEQLATTEGTNGVAFGFPSGRSMRLAEYCGVAVEVDRWLELHLLPERVAGAPRIRPWRAEGSDSALAKWAWSRLAVSLSDAVLGVRDMDYLVHRYLRHPAFSYQIMVVESAWLGRPIGLLVLRRHEHCFELLDLLAAWEDMPQMLCSLRNWLALSHGELAVLNLTESFARQLAPFVSSLKPTEFRIMGNPFCLDPALRGLDDRWWLTGGDTEYR
jgi:hypothetical protein